MALLGGRGITFLSVRAGLEQRASLLQGKKKGWEEKESIEGVTTGMKRTGLLYWYETQRRVEGKPHGRGKARMCKRESTGFDLLNRVDVWPTSSRGKNCRQPRRRDEVRL